MKRVNENDGGTKNSVVFKKGRLLNEIHGSDGALEGTQGEEERAFTGNEAMVSVEMDEKKGYLGNEVFGDFGSSSPGGLKQADQSDFGHNEQQDYIDLNVAVFPGITQEEPVIDQRRKEIIDIASDGSDDEVEIAGFNGGTRAKETLNHGSERNLLEYFVGGNGPVTGGERNYAGKEEGMTSIDDSWLSLNNFDPNDVEFMARQSEALPAIPDRNELELRREAQASRRREEALRYREEVSEMERAYRRQLGKQLARPNHLGESSGNRTSDERGPLSEDVELFMETMAKIASQVAVKWKPSLENLNLRIQSPLVPSLLDLSVKALAENAEGLESLELLPDMLRRRLTDVLCDTSRINVHILNLLVKGCPTEIRIKNCSWLSDEQFHQAFNNCQTKNLMVLQLDLCGQIIMDLAFRDMLSRSSNKFSSLAIISLRGACRLSDSGLKEIVLAAPYLLSINLGQCSLLTCDGINFVADLLASNLRELYIDECPKINGMQILPAFRKFRCLEVLSVREIQGVTDQLIDELLNSCGKSIKELDLENCQELTDRSLKSIGSKCVHLRSLNISNLHNLTDMGMEHLTNGCKSMQKLKLRCNGFSDEVLSSFLESSGGSLTELSLNYLKKVGPQTTMAIAKCSRMLSSLDLSWCRGITDECVGKIVDGCSSLKLLKLFGCKQITSLSLQGHSDSMLRIVGPNSTPLLENLDLPEREHLLLRYSAPKLNKPL